MANCIAGRKTRRSLFLKLICVVVCSIILTSVLLITANGASASTWQFQTVDPVKISSYGSSLGLDSQGNPHIVYFSSSGVMNYASYNGASWSSILVDSSVMQFALALDSKDSPFIAYITNSIPSTPKIAHLVNSQWQIQNVGTSGSFSSCSISIDSNDFPQLSYYDATRKTLLYAKYVGSTWSVTTVDQTADVGQYNSIAVDGLGNPHISYYDATNSRLKYASLDGSTWTLETVFSGIGSAALYTSLRIDSIKKPHIAFFDWQNNLVKYAYNNGSGWYIETIFSSTWLAPCILALDSHNVPHIVYAFQGVTYASRTSSGWEIVSITNPDESFMYTPSFVFDSNDLPHISYVGQQLGGYYIRYATPVASQYQTTFSQTGINPDYTGTVLTVDNQGYSISQLPVTFNWSSYSSHTYSFVTSLETGFGNRYIWTSTSGLSNSQNNTFSITNSGLVTATYKTQYQLIVFSPFGNPYGQGWYDSGATATFGVTSPSNNATGTQHVFTSWTGTGTGSTNSQNTVNSVRLDNPITEVANWKTQYLVSFVAVPPEAGTTLPSGINQWKDNETTPITATVNPGYIFLKWYSTSNSTLFANPSATLTNAVINGTDTIIANFAQTSTPVASHNITITHIGSGTTSPPDGLYINVTTLLTLKATPAQNYSFMCWLENGTQLSIQNPINYNATNNYVITAVFYDPLAKSEPSPSPSAIPTTNPTSSPTPSLTSSPKPVLSPTPTASAIQSATPDRSPTQNPTVSITPTPSSAPSLVPSPSIPEYPSFLIAWLVIMLTVAGAVYCRKKQSTP